MTGFFDLDIATLPDGVLKSIADAVRAERERRRRISSASRKELQANESASNKVFAALPKPHYEYNHHWLGYLNTLLDQDWSHLFSGDEQRKYYVYVHYQPVGKRIRFVHNKCHMNLSGLPFYIGKGTGERAYDLKRNQGHGETLRSLLGQYKPIDLVSIVKDNLTEAEALEIESKLIYFFGTKYEKGRRGILVNLDIPARPSFNQ